VPWFNNASTFMLFASGIGGAGAILSTVAKAHLERRRVHATLLVSRPAKA
jgi:hypothetical protein